MNRILSFWPILSIVAISLVLRIVKLNELFYFTYDESVFAFVGRRLILWQHIPLIGGATPLGFHVAPYFYWFFALTLGIGKLDPIVWGYVSALIGAITTLLIYYLGKSIDSKKLGFIAAVLWAFSYLANIYDRHFWGLTFGPLFSLLVIFFLHKIIKGYTNFIYPLALTLGLIIHADLSYYVFLLLVILVWFIFKLPRRNNTAIAVVIISLSFFPIVIFDIRHNLANSKPIIDFVQRGKNSPGFNSQKFINNLQVFPAAFSRLIYTSGDNQIAKQYSYCPNYISERFSANPEIFTIISWLILIGFVTTALKKKKESTGFYLLAMLTLLYFLGIQIYGTIFKAEIFEHYISGLFAVFALIFARAISLLPKKIWVTIVAIFVFANLYKLSAAKNDHGIKYKKQAIEFTMQQVGEKPFSLDSHSTCWKYSGYRYLFAVYGREPVKSYVDPNLGYLYGSTPIAKDHPETVVAFVTHDFVEESTDFYKRYAILKSHEIANGIFGNIEVIVMDNSSKWFENAK